MLDIILYEHESKKYQDLGFAKVGQLKEVLRKLNLQFRGKIELSLDKEDKFDEDKGILELYLNKVKASHYVGFASSGKLSIQILPKVFKPAGNVFDEDAVWDSVRAFLLMLDRVFNLRLKEYDLAFLGGRKFKPNLFEVFVFFFAKSLWNEVRRGFHRDYVRLEKEEKFLRGKLNLSKQIRKLPHQLLSFSVESCEFTEDILLNRSSSLQ
jgi:5-methylcytosine-specific restriction enzyme subunit McrC